MTVKSSLFCQLDATPVVGISLAGLSVLRLDQCGGNAPGNKWFKLHENIAHAKTQGIKTLLSFGGAWSNHLHALAAIGQELGLQTIGIVRGEEPANPSAMLCDAQQWGMKLVYVSRQAYKSRGDKAYIEELQARFGPCLVIPEGGANLAGVTGCTAIADMLREAGHINSQIVMAVGTGTTLAGVAVGLGKSSGAEVVGVSVLKGAYDLDEQIELFAGKASASWNILHDHHCGGYARVSPPLREFVLAFEQAHGIALDPVYTGKALFAIHQLVAMQQWDLSRPTIFIHTGGLQGRRGYSWLS